MAELEENAIARADRSAGVALSRQLARAQYTFHGDFAAFADYLPELIDSAYR